MRCRKRDGLRSLVERNEMSKQDIKRGAGKTPFLKVKHPCFVGGPPETRRRCFQEGKAPPRGNRHIPARQPVGPCLSAPNCHMHVWLCVYSPVIRRGTGKVEHTERRPYFSLIIGVPLGGWDVYIISRPWSGLTQVSKFGRQKTMNWLQWGDGCHDATTTPCVQMCFQRQFGKLREKKKINDVQCEKKNETKHPILEKLSRLLLFWH